jgi:2'-5' RNA ligase
MGQIRRCFIALLPPPAVQAYAQEIQQYFAAQYASRAALRSPPHITLQPPFEWAVERQAELVRSLHAFAATMAPIPITLDGFSTFPPRVIFINVKKTPELLSLQTHLTRDLATNLAGIQSNTPVRPFVPHLTVAFRDLTPANFQVAWAEFRDRPLHFEFTVSTLTLLVHDGQRWQVDIEVPLPA